MPNADAPSAEYSMLPDLNWHGMLRDARVRYLKFILSCHRDADNFALTTQADATVYASCFAIFGLHLLGERALLAEKCEILFRGMRESIRRMRCENVWPLNSKPYRQLLTFTLSALHVLGVLKDDPLGDLVMEQINCDVAEELAAHGCLHGKAGSGNQAMFLAIFLLHGRDHLGLNTQPLIDTWVEKHLLSMNRFGFWGPDSGMTHLQFQNGYHQHEILEYLGVENPRLEQTLAAVRGLADAEGHFAPYPGGGGCYDYDAVFMLTPHGRIPDEATRRVLERTASTLLAEQNPDGGFCESHQVRPRSASQLAGFIRHVWAARGNPEALLERVHYGLTLQRPKHDRIHTHWSRYSRRWDESNLWDSWFRMLTLARIDVALHPEHAGHWGFIDYPGIGYHPSLRERQGMA